MREPPVGYGNRHRTAICDARDARGPACAAACPTKALRLIDAQFMERARQNKRKAAARASASFASMKLNAALDEGE